MAKENRNITLVIDSHCIGHIAKHTTGMLSYGDLETGIVFGFLQNIYRYAAKFNTIDFVFVWDSRVSKRTSIFPNYQIKRKTSPKSEEEIRDIISMQNQLMELRTEILPSLGFNNIFQQPGYESDDIIAKLVMNNSRNFMIVSIDADLLQLLDYSKIYDPKKRKIIDAATLLAERRVTPSEWITVKSIAGCSSDEIPGIVGVAEKTATKYVRGELKNGVAYNRILEGEETINRNRGLIKLPISGTEDVILNNPPESLNYEAFYDLCDRYSFVSFLRELDSWKKILRLR